VNTGRRVIWGASALVATVAIGVIGYWLIEGWSFLDAIYMTVITITTVGYSEIHPLSSGGQIFSVFLIVAGVGGAIYAMTGIVQYIVEGNIRTTWGRRRMKQKIAQLRGHIILCGYGRVGEEITRTFTAEGAPFVVIENRPDCIARLEQTDYLYVEGDATRDEVLKEAGIKHAHTLVSAVGSDADNTYITLSARGLRPDIFIEARASSAEAERKLERAGANRIVYPLSIGGRRMAMLALRPAVVDFIDTLIHSHGREMQLENVIVTKNSRLVGQTAKTARNDIGITPLAIRRKSGRLVLNPADEEIIEDSDQLIVIGTRERLAALEEALQ